MKKKTEKQQALAEFRTVPGVGKTIAQDFWDLGFRSLNDLKDAHAEQLYEALCELQGVRVDRCMLYVFRCTIYFVSEHNHQSELLKWWNWKD